LNQLTGFRNGSTIGIVTASQFCDDEKLGLHFTQENITSDLPGMGVQLCDTAMLA
jgi:hypothetical protein